MKREYVNLKKILYQAINPKKVSMNKNEEIHHQEKQRELATFKR